MKTRKLPVIIIVLGLTLALTAATALADGIIPVPVPIFITQGNPVWTPIPGAAGVQYAPNLQYDVFRYRGAYYCQYGGRWYQAGRSHGPWLAVQGPPPVFHRIESRYYKTPPGWSRGKKTGWHGAPMPPGQMKKYGYGDPHVPPGHLHKMGY